MEAEDWIQQSLARLEALEEERTTVEAALEEAEDPGQLRRLSERLESLDKEIKGLYAALEAAADGEQEEEAEEAEPAAASEELETDQATALFRREDLQRMAEATDDPAAAAFLQAREAAQQAQQAAQPATPPAGFGAPAPAPAGFGAPQAPAPAGFGGPAGFGAPQAPAPGGFGAPPSPGFGPPMAASSDFADLDEPAGGKSKMPLIAVVIGLLVVGVGGYMFLGNKADETPTDETPAGPAKVIKAGELPPDTQGPRAAKGADVDSVEGSRFKEGRPSAGGSSRPSGGGSGSSTKEKKKDNSKTKIIETDDPLAGIDGK